MANRKRRLTENVAGNFYVDSSCYNCGLSRRYAPDIFGDTGSHAFVKQQPTSDQEMMAAKQALLVCPVGAIGTLEKIDLQSALATFPMRLVDGVYLTGFNSRKSYGANSYFIRSTAGNWLVDSPRFSSHLVKAFEAAGGLKYIFLTHRDDVADADKYAKRFSAQRIIHQYEQHSQRGAEIVLEGTSNYQFDEATIIFTPGHTEGHLIMLWKDRYLFTGDHLWWNPDAHRLGASRRYCWHSYTEQIRSVEKLAVHNNVEWVFPGHGERREIPRRAFPQMIAEGVEWMTANHALSSPP